MATVPELTVCPTCDGAQIIRACADEDCYCWTPCDDCCCDVCGDPTDTPPLCARHQREQDDLEAAKAWREGRHE